MTKGFWTDYYHPEMGQCYKNRVDIVIELDDADARSGKRCLRFNHVVTEDMKGEIE